MKLRPALAILAGALALTACGGPSQAPLASTATSSSAPLPSLHHDAGSDVGLEGPLDTPEPVKIPAWTESEKERAATVAKKAATAFVDTSVTPNVWRKNLAQFLTKDAQDLYSTASNESLPYGEVTKSGAPARDPKHPMFVDVPVQVDGGSLLLRLQYTEDYRELLVYKIEQG